MRLEPQQIFGTRSYPKTPYFPLCLPANGLGHEPRDHSTRMFILVSLRKFVVQLFFGLQSFTSVYGNCCYLSTNITSQLKKMYQTNIRRFLVKLTNIYIFFFQLNGLFG